MGLSVSHFKNGIKKELGVTFGKDILEIDNWVTGLTEKENGYLMMEFLDINKIKMIIPDAEINISLDEEELNNVSSKIEGRK